MNCAQIHKYHRYRTIYEMVERLEILETLYPYNSESKIEIWF